MAGAGVCLLAGCSFLAPQPDRSHYFVLTPVVAVDAGVDVRSLRLGIGPVTLPEYLRRPQIVRRSGDNRLVVSRTHLWREPLEWNVRRVVSQNLGRLLGSVEIVEYPWITADAIEYQIAIEVLRFEADEHGTVHLDARWAIRRSGVRQAASGVVSQIVEPATDASTESVVKAMSVALGVLSREIEARLH